MKLVFIDINFVSNYFQLAAISNIIFYIMYFCVYVGCDIVSAHCVYFRNKLTFFLFYYHKKVSNYFLQYGLFVLSKLDLSEVDH